MYYNFTNITAGAQSPTGFIQIVSSMTVYMGVPLLGLGLLILCWFVLFAWAKSRADSLESLSASSWGAMIIAILLGVLEILPYKFIFIPIAVQAGCIYAMHQR